MKVVSPDNFHVPGQRSTGKKSAPTLLAPDEACVLKFVKYIDNEKPDVLLFEGVGLLKFCEMLFSGHVAHRPKLVLDCHNVESVLWEETVYRQLSGWRRFWKGRRMKGALRGARRADREAVRLCDRVLVPTRQDRARLSELLEDEGQASKIRVVPNIAPGWSLEQLEAAKAPEIRKDVRRLIFVGHLRYGPNVDAVDFLLHRVWPRLRSEFPQLQLIIAGRSPARRIRRWTSSLENVVLEVDPVSLREIYAGSDAVIVPLRHGGGSRLKILEALAVGAPVIATDKAIEGLDLVEGRHWLKAETPKDYVKAVRRLEQEAGIRETLVRESRAFVAEDYTLEALRKTLAPVFSELLEHQQ